MSNLILPPHLQKQQPKIETSQTKQYKETLAMYGKVLENYEQQIQRLLLTLGILLEREGGSVTLSRTEFLDFKPQEVSMEKTDEEGLKIFLSELKNKEEEEPATEILA